MNKEITREVALGVLQGLITDRLEALSNTLAFLEEERENLEAEVKNYKKHLRKIRGAADECHGKISRAQATL